LTVTARTIGLVVLGVSLASRADAQGAPAAVAPVPDRWAVVSDLGLNAARGNSKYTMLSTGLRVTHLVKKDFELDWATALTYGESDVTVIARRMSTALKGDYRPTATWSPFAFASVERDRIRKIDALANAGAGAKWTFFRNAAGTGSLSAAGVYSHKDVIADTTQKAWRLSLRPKVAQKFVNGYSIEQVTFYQPELGNPGDYNVDAVTRLGYSPSRAATLYVQYTYRDDSRPPSGVKREDQLMLAGVKLGF
jgi:hypothetical protein